MKNLITPILLALIALLHTPLCAQEVILNPDFTALATFKTNNSTETNDAYQRTNGTGGDANKVGGSATTAVDIFIPVDSDPASNTSQNNYALVGDNFNDGLPFVTTANDGEITLRLRATAGSDLLKFNIGVVTDDDATKYHLVGTPNSHGDAPANSTIDTTITLNLSTICALIKKCDTFEKLEVDTQKITLYIFLSSATSTPANPFLLTDHAKGFFVNFNLSNKVQNGSTGVQDVVPSFDDLRKGDEQLTAIFSGTPIADYNRTLFFQYPSIAQSASGKNNNPQVAKADGATEIHLEGGVSVTSGDIKIKGLTNGTVVHLAVAYVNDYQFASNVSNLKSETPETIDAFLQKNACFLISAGFLKDHYVLDYLRNFRDQTLLENPFGRLFVQWYYTVAPYYAHIIAQHQFLRWTFRGLGHFLYFFLKYLFWPLAFLMPALVLCLFIPRFKHIFRSH